MLKQRHGKKGKKGRKGSRSGKKNPVKSKTVEVEDLDAAVVNNRHDSLNGSGKDQN